MFATLLFTSLLTVVSSHYHAHDWNSMTHFTHPTNESCDFAQLYSYHIHVIFWGNNPNHTASAIALRNKFIERFDLYNKNCTIEAGDPAPGHEMCVFEVDWQAAGPFLAAQYSFFIPPALLEETSGWMLQHKGIHDVFIHPNSGCETNDHTKWYTFSGAKWPIDASIFTCDYPGCRPKSYY